LSWLSISSLTVDRPLPVMDSTLAPRRRHQLAAHHQQAVLITQDEALDHHVAAFGVGDVVGRLNVFLLSQVQRHAPAMVAVRAA
jgi:hypothetical protein